MLKIILIVLALMTAGTAVASEELEALSWLEGHWVADAFGGISEEVWLPAAGDSMHGVFRLTMDGKMNFSEFIQLTVEDGHIMMRFEHFRPDYSTWEGEGPPMELKATTVGPGNVVFEALNEAKANRIEYRLVDDELQVAVSGIDGVLRFARK